ncbi:PhoX family protein [Stutzerimonas stutzeri]|uniref:Phosphatase n=1 Tax=Stutzerimonas stutzeri KOS6 TaxID=1218352 RepID=A0A061JWM2_STUST|nr:PhoX family phosphatase [Stutzerimonas stutzeri]EWC43290.1 phosphatase [Stutzerimonas stutzeri KOS6]
MSRETGDSRTFNTSHNEPMDSVLDKYLSRRSVVRGGLGAAIAMITGVGLTGCFDSDSSSSDSASPTTPEPTEPVALSLGFESIPGSKTDAAVVAAGYTARVFAPWGTPLNSLANAWQDDGSNSAQDQANAVGMHHDGMHFFPINGSSEDGLLVMNHEYIDQNALHPNGATLTDGVRPAEEVRKEINAHGVSVLRITKVNGRWQVIQNDPLNRRFTTASVMDLAGPLRGTDHVKTPFSRNGTQTRGTNNNCGNGYTPWGTYLTCEENWPGVFVNTSGALPEDQSRIGISTRNGNYRWETAAGDASEVDDEFARFDITPRGASALEDYRNEASGYGYIVEIDPYDASTRAVKRTALGRFRHEGCWPGLTEAGKPVVFYMGDDAQHEYLYKFVSAALWDPADANPSDRLATGAKYMNEGTLYVARFDADGSGVWLPLTEDSLTQSGRTLGSIYGDLPSIILNTRGAADALGATPMDRPEWTTVNPVNGDVYLTLTNNSNRTEANAANPRVPNVNGHIIRWRDADNQTDFTWDIFVYGSDANAGPEINRSGLTDLNQFASPDGLVFDSRGILWIQTDNGGNAVANATNDQMLAVIPSTLVDAEGNQVPVSAENQGDLRRFFVGPNGCEVTGLAFTPDNKTLFLNIQHPRNWPYSEDATEAAPAGTTVRPRASTVVIERIDGGEIAL